MIARPGARKTNGVKIKLSGSHGTSPIKMKARPNNTCQRRPQNDLSSEQGDVESTTKSITGLP